MSYTVSYSSAFKAEFKNYPIDQQNAVLAFTDVFEEHGLGDFTKYVGKLAPSWSGIDASNPNYAYAMENNLWHYHIGLPKYISWHSKYQTSDMVLHFQWVQGGKDITLVDVYSHQRADGTFYLPSKSYLT